MMDCLVKNCYGEEKHGKNLKDYVLFGNHTNICSAFANKIAGLPAA